MYRSIINGCSFCKNNKDVTYSIEMNASIICIPEILCKRHIVQWCDFFASLLESYSLVRHNNDVGTKIAQGLRYFVFKKNIFSINYDIVCEADKDENPLSTKTKTNLESFYNKKNSYLTDLLYDSVTQSYHTNIHKRTLTRL